MLTEGVPFALDADNLAALAPARGSSVSTQPVGRALIFETIFTASDIAAASKMVEHKHTIPFHPEPSSVYMTEEKGASIRHVRDKVVGYSPTVVDRVGPTKVPRQGFNKGF